MCFTCFSCQFVFNKRFLKIYCLSVHSFFLVSFISMYTTLQIISRKFLGVSLIWTFFSHVGAIFFKQPITDCNTFGKNIIVLLRDVFHIGLVIGPRSAELTFGACCIGLRRSRTPIQQTEDL